jgi:thymidylate kinase
MKAAKQRASEERGASANISRWDASGIFGDLDVAGLDAERPSARTLLLLYAADLAFRLRWEIRPALAEGRRIIAAPYVDTAIAIGRAAGIDNEWLHSVFQFAPAPTERCYVQVPASARAAGHGFAEFACRRLYGLNTRTARQDLIARAQARLKSTRHRAPA